MKIKRIGVIISVVALLTGASSVEALANSHIDAYVTICDKDGNLALAQEKISVTDKDDDGKITINDTLYCAHEQKYQGGAESGYKSAKSEFGISLIKLWGQENGESFGYYKNNSSSNGLNDEVNNGDYINAFAYNDLILWSDKYVYFDVHEKTADEKEKFTLTLKGLGYDADWNTIVSPIANAVITVDGKRTEFVTDENGKAEISLDLKGNYIVSAVSDNETLVAPVCNVTVNSAAINNQQEIKNENPKTGDTGIAIMLAAALLTLMCGILLKKIKNEK